MFGGIGIMGSDLQDFIDGKKVTKDEGTDDTSSTAAGSKFDRDVSIRRAQREHVESANSARSTLQEAENICSETMNQVRGNAEFREKFSQELRILDARLRFLHLVLCGPVLALQALIENYSAEPIDSAVGGSGATSDSRSLGQLCQAPPIPAYEKLLTIDEIIAEGAELRECETAADLEKKSAELEQSVALVLELRSATLNCKEDLCNAQTAYVKAVKLATQKAAREKAKLEQKKSDGDKPGEGAASAQRVALLFC